MTLFLFCILLQFTSLPPLSDTFSLPCTLALVPALRWTHCLRLRRAQSSRLVPFVVHYTSYGMGRSSKNREQRADFRRNIFTPRCETAALPFVDPRAEFCRAKGDKPKGHTRTRTHALTIYHAHDLSSRRLSRTSRKLVERL